MLLVLTSLALAQEAPPIVNGEETSDFPAVGVLVALNDNGAGYEFCSGTLVHKSWVITAAHCVDAFEDNERYGYGNHYFMIGTDIYDVNGIDDYARVKDAYMNPDYNTRDLSYDIGIVELYTPITSVDPIPVNDETPSLSWGDITYVGWGITGDDRDDQYNSGVKRTADVPVYYVTYYHVYTYDGVDYKNICSGDSGGAMLYPEDGMYKLVGANSFGFNLYGGQPTCEGEGSASAATRVDTSLDWLESFVDLYRVEDFSTDPGDAEPGDDGGTDGGGTDGGGGGTDGTDGGGTDGGGTDGGGNSGGGNSGGGNSGGGVDNNADTGIDQPAQPSEGLADAKSCSSVGGGGALGFGALLLAALGLVRRREER